MGHLDNIGTFDTHKLMVLSYYVSLENGMGMPTLFTGPPGATKTHEVGKFAREMGVPFVHISPSQRGEGFFGAAPCRGMDGDDAVLDFPPPREIIQLHRAQRGIILVDELRTAPRAVRPALLGIILERRFGALHMNHGIRVFGASNSALDSSGNGAPLDAPTANRFCHVNMQDPTLEQASAYWADCSKPRTYARDARKVSEEKYMYSQSVEEDIRSLRIKMAPKASALVANFLRSTNGAWRHAKDFAHHGPLRAQPKTGSPDCDGGWGSPRSWSSVFELVVTALSLADISQKQSTVHGHRFETDLAMMREFAVMFDGLVGPLSTAFLAQISGLNIIEPTDWLDGKEKLTEDDSPDRIYATFQAGSAYLVGASADKKQANETRRRAEVFFSLAERFPSDLVYGPMQNIGGNDSTRDLTTGPAASRAMAKFNILKGMTAGR